MKIILSRKGFDSGAGGYPSPFFVKEGRLLSLPIPEKNKVYTVDTGRLYSDLLFENDTTYLDIMEQLGMKGFAGKNAHLDPDINQNVMGSRKPGWKGLFGQCDTAQQHLCNKRIQPGDLFLFFGWFKEVVKIDGKYKYVSGTDKHIIWGYMQIGEIDSIRESTEYESWKLEHPHYCNKNRKYNTAYIANEFLDFSLYLPGCGVFKYNESLVLSCPSMNNKSIWKLPLFFHPYFGTHMTYHENTARWKLHDDHCSLQSVSRGQEFVVTGNDQIVEWAKELLLNSIKNKFEKSEVEIHDIKKLIAAPHDENTHVSNKGNIVNSQSIITMKCIRNATGEQFDVKYNVEDNIKVQQYQWKIEKSRLKVYAVKQGTENIFLHRLIVGNCEGKRVIARNGNFLDCRRENLIIQE